MIGVPSTIDKYELKKRLGYGGLAEVWKAWDTQLHRYVAIKLLHTDIQHDPNFVTRFEREAQFVASLHHRNIIRIYDFRMYPHREIDVQTMDSNEQIAYMVMEYIEGQTLAQYLRKTSHTGDIPSAADLLHIFEPISLAIDYAHEKGMVHRDIKPSNILLDQRGGQGSLIGEPMLSDFGIAKLLNSSTFSNWRMGTPLYISPEQALGYSENEQCDIYALGVILYEACTGKMPFNGDNPMAIAMQHVNASFPLPHVVNPQLPEELSDVIAKGLAKDPAERFTTASAMCIAMAEAFSLPVSKRLKQAVAHDQESREGELPTVVISSSPSDTPPALHEAVMNVSIPSSISQDDVALESATDSMHRPGQTHESSSIYTLTSIRKKRFRNQAIIALV